MEKKNYPPLELEIFLQVMVLQVFKKGKKNYPIMKLEKFLQVVVSSVQFCLNFFIAVLHQCKT
jgi:hypothetical protein